MARWWRVRWSEHPFEHGGGYVPVVPQPVDVRAAHRLHRVAEMAGDVILILQEHLDLGWTNVDVIEFLSELVRYVEGWVVPGISGAI
jgi:hypothetical protein